LIHFYKRWEQARSAGRAETSAPEQFRDQKQPR